MTPKPVGRSVSARRLFIVGVGLALTIVGLRLAARVLDGPPFGGPTSLGAWADERGPAHVTFALLRGGAELAAWYLLGLVVINVVAAVCRVRGAAAIADRLATPAVARLLRIGLGVGLVMGHAGVNAGGRAGVEVATADPAETSQRRPEAATSAKTGTASIRPATDRPDPATPPAPSHSNASIRPVHDAPAARGTDTRGATIRPVGTESNHRVTEGESFWSIAADIVEHRTGADPSNEQIDPVWRALVDRNRDRLVDPGNPDLLHAGQVLDVPA